MGNLPPEVIPSILTNDIREVSEKVKAAEFKVKRVQIDVVDGTFAQNRTIDPAFLESIETDLNLDFHLMTKEPAEWVERATRGGADRIIGQIEMMGNQVDFLGKVQEAGPKIGLAIDINTPVSALDATILTNLDVVLVMSVPAGFGGQKFDDGALAKIKELDEIRTRDNTPFRICVDGGISEENIKKVVQAGADEVVIGRKLFEGDISQNIENLVKASQ